MPERIRRTRDRGATAVEFVLLVPILVVLLFGIIGFGWLFSQQLALNNAVREGARFAVAVGNTTSQQCGQIATNVHNALSASTIPNPASNVTVDAERADGTKDCTNASTVLCTGSFNPSTGAIDSIEVTGSFPTSILLLGGPNVTLTAKAVYRCEFN